MPMRSRACWTVIATLLLTTSLKAGEYDISLSIGWNTVSFPCSPGIQQPADLPIEVTGIVAYRVGQTLRWERAPDAARDGALPDLPATVSPLFAGQGQLDLASLQAHEGYLVYASGPTKLKVSVSVLVPLMKLEAEKWTFCGVPVGAFGSAIPENQFSPPPFAPAVTMFGDSLDVFYLGAATTTAINVKRAWTVADLKGTVDPANPTKNVPWNLKQAEAVWVKSRVAIGNDTKVEVRSSSSLSVPGSVVLDLDDSSSHVDLQVRLIEGRVCTFGLQERDWYFSPQKPGEQALSGLIVAAQGSSFTPAGFTQVAARTDQPNLVFSSAAVVAPFLETSQGPLNPKRALRVSCDRMTKGVPSNAPGGGGRIARILQPGFYLGRLELMAAAVTEGGGIPTVVVLLEVPELYGPYEGFVHAQVLSVRDEMRESPLEFFRNHTAVTAGPIPFAKLMDAALPNARSIEIGRFPLRCKLSQVQGNSHLMQAVLEKRGSFIVNADTTLSATYQFVNNVQDFHGIQVALPQEKKTVFLESGLLTGQFKPAALPLLARPIAVPTGTRVAVQLAGSDRANPQLPIVVRRDIKFLMQEELAGVLRGLMIERLGRSTLEPPDGAVLGEATIDAVTNNVRSASVPTYIIGLVELRRVPKGEDNP